MDLSTRYLGFELDSPLIPGASPLTDSLDLVRQLEDAGAPALVMRSLFEEQLASEQLGTYHATETHADAHPEARGYFASPPEFKLGPDAYLEQIRRIREAVKIPVIGSLNGLSPAGWLDYAELIVQAGAQAIELNLYDVPTDPACPAGDLERRALDVVRLVRRKVSVPLAVKLSPFYSSLPHFAVELEKAGAQGIVLFNRFYQPDIDPVALEVAPILHLSDSSELLLRLRWLAVLSPLLKISLAASGGAHSHTDAIKAIMAGAHVVQVVSALLRKGPAELATLRKGMAHWLEENEFSSVAQIRGNMNLARCPNPHAFERANYMKLLQSWTP